MLGMSRHNNEYDKTEADLEKIKQNKDFLEKKRGFEYNKNADCFYNKISDDRKD
jgi:hypothetical protein